MRRRLVPVPPPRALDDDDDDDLRFFEALLLWLLLLLLLLFFAAVSAFSRNGRCTSIQHEGITSLWPDEEEEADLATAPVFELAFFVFPRFSSVVRSKIVMASSAGGDLMDLLALPPTDIGPSTMTTSSSSSSALCVD